MRPLVHYPSTCPFRARHQTLNRIPLEHYYLPLGKAVSFGYVTTTRSPGRASAPPPVITAEAETINNAGLSIQTETSSFLTRPTGLARCATARAVQAVLANLSAIKAASAM
jgi:hypothetical protein